MAMSSVQLKAILSELDLNQAEFAKLVDVSVSAVSQWLSDTRTIPGPVEAYLSLFSRLPAEFRRSEIARAVKGRISMRNGMYLISFVGSYGTGEATLTFKDGLIYGFDTGGGMYDGSFMYGDSVDSINASVRCCMPPNAVSVIGGLSHPFEWSLEFLFSVSTVHQEGQFRITMRDMPGQFVDVRYKRMRDLPLAA